MRLPASSGGKENKNMTKRMLIGAGFVALMVLAAVALKAGAGTVTAKQSGESEPNIEPVEPVADDNGFSVEVLIGGRSASEYFAAGRRYVEALENAEYELRI